MRDNISRVTDAFQTVVNLAYRVHPGRGPYLALLHGFLSSSSQWQDNLAALSEHVTPVTIELWGHGASPSPDDPAAYTPQRYVAELERIRQALGAQQWYLCGYSIGAGMTIRYVHTHPERVIAHAFTNSASAFADEAMQSAWHKDGMARSGRIVERGLKEVERIAVHPKFAKRLPRATYDALMRDAATLCPRAIAHTITYTTPQASIRGIAAVNPRPALLCHGVHERRFEPLAQWAQQHMAQLQIAPIDAGHAVNMEAPAAFNQALSTFFTQHQP